MIRMSEVFGVGDTTEIFVIVVVVFFVFFCVARTFPDSAISIVVVFVVVQGDQMKKSPKM
jgi:hypothetical protein